MEKMLYRIIVTLTVAVAVFLGWFIFNSALLPDYGWEIGYYGQFNRVKHVIEDMPGVTIVGRWRHRDVLLLEAGGRDDLPVIDDPRAFVETFNTPMDWAYATVPESELNGRSLEWPRGKVLGGTSHWHGANGLLDVSRRQPLDPYADQIDFMLAKPPRVASPDPQAQRPFHSRDRDFCFSGTNQFRAGTPRSFCR